WCLIAALIRAGGRWISGCRESDHQVLHSESGERTGRRQGQTIVRECRLAVVTFQMDACGKRDCAQVDRQTSRPEHESFHGIFLFALLARECWNATRWGLRRGAERAP